MEKLKVPTKEWYQRTLMIRELMEIAIILISGYHERHRHDHIVAHGFAMNSALCPNNISRNKRITICELDTWSCSRLKKGFEKHPYKQFENLMPHAHIHFEMTGHNNETLRGKVWWTFLGHTMFFTWSQSFARVQDIWWYTHNKNMSKTSFISLCGRQTE